MQRIKWVLCRRNSNKQVIRNRIQIKDQIWNSKLNNKFNKQILKAHLICQNLTLLNK